MSEIDVFSLLSPGARFILFLGFDVDIDSAEVWRGADPVEKSYAQYGAVKGVDKVINVLKRYGVDATFFVPGWVAENYPHVVKGIYESGYEIGGHGYLHEKLDLIEDEYEVWDKMDKALTGYYREVKGYRSPYWRFSDKSLEYLSQFGYVYDSSLMDNDVPYIFKVRNHEILELPVDWRLDDWPNLKIDNVGIFELYKRWVYEFKVASRDTGYISLTFHPQLIGRGTHIILLERIIKKAVEMGGEIVSGIQLYTRISNIKK